jgi:glutathione S-transferase
MADLTLYTNPMSRGRIARLMLEELGQPYDTRVLAYGAEMRTPEYLALNPMAKVPTVTHGDVVVTECAAICTYLADAFPEAGLAPAPGSPERGAYFRWMFFAAGPVEAAVTNASLGITVDTPEVRGRVGYGDMTSVLDTLEGLLSDGREWLLGARFSALDVYLGSQIGWGVQFGSMESRPGFQDYVGRLHARPAARRAAELDDALVAGSG